MVFQAEQLRAAAANGASKALRQHPPDAHDYEREERVALGDESNRVSPFRWIPSPEIFEALPSTKWVVQGLQICPGRLSMFVAYGNTGKTLAMQAMALAYASGTRVWGEFPTGRGGTVRHVDYEQGRHATLKRYQRLALGMRLSPEEIGDRLQVSIFPGVYLNSAGAVDTYAREFEGVDLAFVDALRGATPGHDENDSKIRECLDNLSRASEKTGTCFVVIHHAGKPKEGHSDARTVARGSSAIFDACGSVFVMTGEKGEPKRVSHQKSPAEAEGGAVEDFYLAIEDVPLEDDPRAGVRVVYQTKEEVDPPVKPTVMFEEKVGRVLECIRQNPGVPGVERIAEMIAMRPATVRQAIGALLEANRITDRGTAKPARPRLFAMEVPDGRDG